MSKTLTRRVFLYGGFAAAGILVMIAFISSKNYLQLIGASLLYIPLVIFARKIFPGKIWDSPIIQIEFPKRQAKPVKKQEPTRLSSKNSGHIVDLDRRAFLKLIGATGISFFLFSLLGRRVDTLFSSNAAPTAPTGNVGTLSQTAASPTAQYKIAEIADGIITYYGFTNNSGGWLIMREDSQNGSFRYAKGDSGFPENWGKRERLKYDYFSNLR